MTTIATTVKALEAMRKAEEASGNNKEKYVIEAAIAGIRSMKADLVAAADEFDSLVGADLIPAAELRGIRARLNKTIKQAGGR